MRSTLIPAPAASRLRGFTLIELLVVIAIIAILTAILLPVFATVRENARASSSIANMHELSTALAQFQLDQHKYPDVLFGYAYPDHSWCATTYVLHGQGLRPGSRRPKSRTCTSPVCIRST